MSEKTILFSPEVAPIGVVTNKAIERSAKKSIGIGLIDYRILQQLYVYNTKVKSTMFQEFLLLKPNSVTSAVMRLDEKVSPKRS